MTSAIIEKIKKLLSLGNGTEFARERDLALGKAAALAASHNIDLALLDLSDIGVVKDEPIIKEDAVIGTSRTRPVEHRFIYGIIVRYFEVDMVRGWRCQWTFIGTKQNVEFARWLFGYLVEEFNRRWTYYRKTELAALDPIRARAYRNTFMYGLWQGLDEKLREARAAEESARINTAVAASASADAPNTSTAVPVERPRPVTAEELKNRYALVVQDAKAKREAATREFFPSLRTGRASRTSIRDHGTLSAGRASGRTISCARPLGCAA